MGERQRQALVVGASNGSSVGFAIARAMAEAGWAVTVTSRAHREAELRPFAEAAGLRWQLADVDVPESLEALFAERDGPLDALVHALVRIPAGLDAPLVQLPRAELEHSLSVGAWSLIALCRHALPALQASDSPRVVALSSTLAERVAPHYHALGITKAALEAAVRYLALELGPSGITCNAVRFGLVPTEGARAALGGGPIADKLAARASRLAPIRDELGAESVARFVRWLCGSEAGHLTGQTLTVDAGLCTLYN